MQYRNRYNFITVFLVTSWCRSACSLPGCSAPGESFPPLGLATFHRGLMHGSAKSRPSVYSGWSLNWCSGSGHWPRWWIIWQVVELSTGVLNRGARMSMLYEGWAYSRGRMHLQWYSWVQFFRCLQMLGALLPLQWRVGCRHIIRYSSRARSNCLVTSLEGWAVQEMWSCWKEQRGKIRANKVCLPFYTSYAGFEFIA